MNRRNRRRTSVEIYAQVGVITNETRSFFTPFRFFWIYKYPLVDKSILFERDSGWNKKTAPKKKVWKPERKEIKNDNPRRSEGNPANVA